MNFRSRMAHPTKFAVLLGCCLALLGCSTPPEPSMVDSPSAGLPSVECRQVPRDLCNSAAAGAIEGPKPDGAGAVEHVIVSCELSPPCDPRREGSGGKVITLYDNGSTWTQDWAVGSGT